MMLRESFGLQISDTLRLLLACAVGSVGPGDGAPDWDHFLTLVRYHRLTPQAADALSGRSDVPAPITRALTREVRSAAVSGLQQAAELAQVAEVLDAAGIPLLALKGPVESILCRGALGHRPAVDIDVFVPPEAATRTLLALRQSGWDILPNSDTNRALHARRDYHCELRRGTHGPRVELHWRLLRIHADYPLTVVDALAIAEPLELAGRVVRTLPLAHRILYLCAHGSHHFWDRASRLLDISLYLRHGLPPEVEPLALRMGLERPLLLSVHLAHHLLGAPVPAWLERARTPGTGVTKLAARALARWDRVSPSPGNSFARWERLSYALALHPPGVGRFNALGERLWRKLAPGQALGEEMAV